MMAVFWPNSDVTMIILYSRAGVAVQILSGCTHITQTLWPWPEGQRLSNTISCNPQAAVQYF